MEPTLTPGAVVAPVTVTPAAPAVHPVTSPNSEQLLQDAAVNLPAIEQVVSDVGGIKTGYKTSEFWITLGTAAVTLIGGLLPANSVWVKAVSAGVAALTSVAYIYSRVSLKKHAIMAQTVSSVSVQ
jgi:hypothetical protein